MAGVGFKLNKIFEKKTITAKSLGVLSSPLTVVGPAFFFLIALFWIRGLLGMWQVDESDVDFFVTSFTSISLVAILVSAFVGPVLSRYISDKVFEEKEGDVAASLYGSMLCVGIVAAIGAGFLSFFVREQESMDRSFLVVYFIAAVLLTVFFQLSGYIAVIKEFSKLCITYAFGAAVFLLVSYLCCVTWKTDIRFGIYLAVASSLFLMVFLLLCFNLKAFGTPGKRYFDFMKYFAKYPYLSWSGIALFTGLCIPNIIQYDTGIFVAVMIHLPGMIVFEVIMKVGFYGKYVKYLSVIKEGAYDLIEKERETLQNGVRLQLLLIYGVQLTVTLVSVSLLGVLVQGQGVTVEQLEHFIVLALGMFFVFCMYDAMVILYYFSAYKEIGFIATVFALVVVISTIVFGELEMAYYFLPLPIGGLLGWIVSIIILRSRLKNINAFILCK